MTHPTYLTFEDLGPDGDAIAWTTRGKKKALVTDCFYAERIGWFREVSSLLDALHLARTPDRRWWVLWRDPDPELKRPWHPIARVPTGGLGAADAADMMVRHVWTVEKDRSGLKRFQGIEACGILERYRVERILDDLWPHVEPITHLRVRAVIRYDCDHGKLVYPTCCPICNAPRVFGGWVPFDDEDDRRRFLAIYGIEPHGRHRRFIEAFFAPFRAACGSCRGSGILGEPPAEPVLCGDCEGLGGHWTCSAAALASAKAAVAQVHPTVMAPEGASISTVVVR